MNRRAVVIALVYSAVVILFKLFILLGGYTLGNFGFYYAHIVSVFLIIPFFFIAIYQVREKERDGLMGGKEAVRIALTVLAVAAVVLSIYNYIEFEWKYRDIAVQYYHSAEYLRVLTEGQAKYPDKLKSENFPRIINEQISSLSTSRFVTGKLFPLIFIGLSGAFVAAIFLKRSVRSDRGLSE